MPIAYIGLGSNINAPLEQTASALNALASIPGTRLVKASPFYRSQAIGPGDQPDYINAVAALETTLTPQTLLTSLQQIENQQGRTRGAVRWTARTLDLDLLLYDDQTINTQTLQVPHPRMTERNFVLLPLQSIAPELQLPSGETLPELIGRCPTSPIELIKEKTV